MDTRETSGATPIGGPSRDVLMILPPDFDAPPKHLKMRFPPLGPAVVAASTAAMGLRFRAVDLVLDCCWRPLEHDTAAFGDGDRIAAWLGGARDEAIDAALDEIAARI
jgi:hypothetical protein